MNGPTKGRVKRWAYGLFVLLMAWAGMADELPLGQYDAKPPDDQPQDGDDEDEQ